MKDYQNYLNNCIREAREYLEQVLIVEKKRIQSNSDPKMARNIKDVEEKFAEIIRNLSEDFKKNMEELETEKKRGVRSSVRLKQKEKFLKNTFEKNLKTMNDMLTKELNIVELK